MSYTPFNAPILAGLLGDPEIVAFFSVKAEIAAMLRFEAALAEAEGEAGVIPADAAEAITEGCARFEPDMKALGEGTARDGVVVPELVRQLKAAIGGDAANSIHFGATSQDVVDTSLILRLWSVATVLSGRLGEIRDAFDGLAERFGERRMTGRTRMQAGLPIRVADRVGDWKRPLLTHEDRLNERSAHLFRLQFGGAVGTLDKLGARADAVAAALAGRLGLAPCADDWHSDRSGIAEFAGWLSLVTGSLGKFGQDVALMAQNGIDEIALSGAGGSSAMPHKQNPVKAEILVTLARFNATLLSGMHQSLVHEQERSGSAWTLEWMLLPQMCVATGAATRTARELVASIVSIGGEG